MAVDQQKDPRQRGRSGISSFEEYAYTYIYIRQNCYNNKNAMISLAYSRVGVRGPDSAFRTI